MEAHGGFDYSAHIATPPARRHTVNIAKHMEAIFVVALAAAGSAHFIAGQLPQAQARPAAIQDSSIATETRMAVVVVKGKRPAAEQRTVLADRSQAGSRL
jgi:heptaprenylglyceryl phosphate synthase